MALVEFDIVSRSAFQQGRSFGAVGTYERIEAVAHYAVDPTHPDHAAIVDLGLAARAADGRVNFSGDVSLVLPVERWRSNGAVLLEVPNRGKRTAFRAFNRAPADLESMARLDVGDAYLLAQGWCVAWPGWQWDVPRGGGRLGLEAPVVPEDRLGEGRQMQLRFQVDRDTPRLALTDQHVGPAGAHRPVTPARDDDPQARLLVRDGLHEEPAAVARERWSFVRQDTQPGPATHVALDGDFRAGRIYDLLYHPAHCPVVGVGLLAIRDLGSWIRRDPQGLFEGAVSGIFAEGQSQTGRLLRTLLHLGLHLDEEGKPAFDGVLAHVAGGRFGEFNMRYGQPSVQPTPGFGHRFPFADDPQSDPRTGTTAGLLDRARERGAVPRVVYTDTSSEYWRGDAALTHIHLASGSDAPLPPEVRRYVFAGTQHGPGAPPLSRDTRFGGRGANPCNVLEYRPLFRAALENLRAWVLDGREPPPSRVPRFDDNTASDRASVLAQLRGVPGCEVPVEAELPLMRVLDLGSEAARGIGEFPARPRAEPYPVVVSAVDPDGNEIAGLRMPDLVVPVATHTGFNPRHPATGAPGQILEYIGSSVPFALDDGAAAAAGDLRRSLASRYRDRDDYLERVRDAARALVADGYLLELDIETCVAIAGDRYDAVLQYLAQGPRPGRADA